MKLSAIIEGVQSTQRKQLAGRAARDQISRRHLTMGGAAKAAKMAPSTLYRILGGDFPENSTKLRALEAILRLPSGLLTFIADGDSVRIAALTDEDLPGDVRRALLYDLDEIAQQRFDDDEDEGRNGAHG